MTLKVPPPPPADHQNEVAPIEQNQNPVADLPNDAPNPINVAGGLPNVAVDPVNAAAGGAANVAGGPVNAAAGGAANVAGGPPNAIIGPLFNIFIMCIQVRATNASKWAIEFIAVR